MEAAEPLEETAVQVRGLEKRFGFHKTKVAVLNQVNLDIPKGCIFGLLGPSGCGKTTLLNCVVGRIRASKGSVRVFGQCPGSVNCNIPGSDVGYMPQELALFGELTAGETLAYFGRICNLSKAKVTERTNFLFNFLNLPTKWKLIKNLSGGQQRRVSFAIALLHEPPLLILDEPTVGVDPILRINIWKHLIEMSSSGNVTTIITTHYVEEAIKAHKVGLMREGQILISAEPQSLLNRYNLSSLEDVFLHLCQNQTVAEKSPAVYYSVESNDKSDDCKCQIFNPKIRKSIEIVRRQASSDKKSRYQCTSKPNCNKICALAIKNFTKLRRAWPALLFQFLTPAVQIIFVCLAISGNPHNLKVAVANEDRQLGKTFLSLIDNTTVHQVPVPDLRTAETIVLQGEAWGLIHIWKNFTISLAKRYLKFDNTTDDLSPASNIHVRLDASNLLISHAVQLALIEAMLQLAKSMDGKLGFDFETATIPLKFGEPIFGADNHNLSEYVIPGAIVVIAFFVAFGLTAMEFALEKKQGLLDRSYVAGVTAVDVMCGHVMIQTVVMTAQVCVVLFCLIVIFQFPCQGNLLWIILLTLAQGTCGMFCGYFISSLFQDEFTIVTVGLGGLFSTVVLSGILWPLEAMPHFMAKLGQLLPQTYAAEAMRCVFSRGWGITYTAVWRGFLPSIIWTIAFLILSLVAVRLRR